jgi:hypothetical protein
LAKQIQCIIRNTDNANGIDKDIQSFTHMETAIKPRGDRIMVFNAIFNNMSVLLVEETRVTEIVLT